MLIKTNTWYSNQKFPTLVGLFLPRVIEYNQQPSNRTTEIMLYQNLSASWLKENKFKIVFYD